MSSYNSEHGRVETVLCLQYDLCEYFHSTKARDIAFLLSRESAAPGTGIKRGDIFKHSPNKMVS